MGTISIEKGWINNPDTGNKFTPNTMASQIRTVENGFLNEITITGTDEEGNEHTWILCGKEV